MTPGTKSLKYVLPCLFLLVAIRVQGQPFYVQGCYDPNLVMDFLGCAHAGGTTCYAGVHGDVFAGWDGKVYGSDSAGNTLFEKRHSLSQHDLWYTSTCAMPGGGFALAGYSAPFAAGTIDVVTTLVDASGNFQSCTRYSNGTNISIIPFITSYGSDYLLGFSSYSGAANSDLCLVRAGSGGIVHQTRINVDSLSGPVYEDMRSVMIGPSGEVYVLGEARTTTMMHQFSFLHKLDNDLELEWTLILPDTAVRTMDLVIKSNGNVFVFGSMRVSGTKEPFLAEVDPAGAIIWSKSYSSILANYYPATLASAPGDGAVLIGAEAFSTQGYLTMPRIRVDSAGQVLFGSNVYGIGMEIEPFDSYTTGRNLNVAGRTTMGQAMVLQLDVDAMLSCYDSAVALTEIQRNLSTSFLIAHQDTANFQSFTGTITVSSFMNKQLFCLTTDIGQVQEGSNVVFANPVSRLLKLENLEYFDHISIFDISGRRIVHQPLKEQGWEMDVQGWVSGLYFIRLQDTTGKTKTLKFVKT